MYADFVLQNEKENKISAGINQRKVQIVCLFAMSKVYKKT